MSWTDASCCNNSNLLLIIISRWFQFNFSYVPYVPDFVKYSWAELMLHVVTMDLNQILSKNVRAHSLQFTWNHLNHCHPLKCWSSCSLSSSMYYSFWKKKSRNLMQWTVKIAMITSNRSYKLNKRFSWKKFYEYMQNCKTTFWTNSREMLHGKITQYNNLPDSIWVHFKLNLLYIITVKITIIIPGYCIWNRLED
jgi:hypothetical protein